MRAILGIDAAWTETRPSGVALVEQTARGWRLKAVEASYRHFEASRAPTAPIGHGVDPDALLAACRMRIGREPDLIAVDMPLSRLPIVGRRISDNEVSRAYGAKKCGTHSPSDKRPGPVSEALRSGLQRRGYHLWTHPALAPSPWPEPGLIEVYPHPALVELTKADKRLEYKVGKISRYWRGATPTSRREKLFTIWRRIVAALEREIEGVAENLPALDRDDSGLALKAFEDALDAVVCAWVGVCVLEGRARAFGDETSAVWIPMST